MKPFLLPLQGERTSLLRTNQSAAAPMPSVVRPCTTLGSEFCIHAKHRFCVTIPAVHGGYKTYLRIGVTVNYKPVKAPCSLFYNTRSRTIKAAEYTASFYLLKFAMQTCILTAQSHFITTVRKSNLKKTSKNFKIFADVHYK